MKLLMCEWDPSVTWTDLLSFPDCTWDPASECGDSVGGSPGHLTLPPTAAVSSQKLEKACCGGLWFGHSLSECWRSHRLLSLPTALGCGLVTSTEEGMIGGGVAWVSSAGKRWERSASHLFSWRGAGRFQ